MSSRFFQGIRDQHGDAYEVTSQTELTDFAGIFGVYTGIETEHLMLVLKRMLEQIKLVRENGLSAEELDKAKLQYMKDLLLDEDNNDDKAMEMGTDELYHHRLIKLEETFNSIISVTNEDIIRFAKEYFDPKYFNFLIIGPKDELPSRSLILDTIKNPDRFPEFPLAT